MKLLRVGVLCVTSIVCFAQPTVVISGLQRPMRLAVTPRGDLLVSETSLRPNEGRISIVTPQGVRRTLIEGLPSGTDVTGGSSGPTAMVMGRPNTLYIAMGAGDVERRGPRAGTMMPNPEGPSSPLFCSVLALRLTEPVEMINQPFRLRPDDLQRLADGYEVPLRNEGGERAEIEVLTQFRCSIPDRNSIYRFSNPWGLDIRGSNLYVADASMDTLVRVDIRTGRAQTMTRFARIPNDRQVGPPVLDAVPDSVHVYGDDLLVTLLTGFPFTPGNSRVMLVDGRTGQPSPFILFNNSVVDLVYRPRRGARAEFYVLEFSTDQGVQPTPPGRLLRYASPSPTVLVDGLIAPTTLAHVPGSDEIYILSLTGTITRVKLP